MMSAHPVSRSTTPPLILLLLLLFSPTAYGQSPVPLVDNFSQSLNTLSQQGRVFILAEGTPHHPFDNQAECRRILRDKGSLPLKLKQIAALFDYDVEALGSSYLLIKKYTDSKEVACVTFEEMRATMNDVRRIAPDACPDEDKVFAGGMDGESRGVHKVLRTLDAAQMTKLFEEGLPFRDLKPAQQDAFRYLTAVSGMFALFNSTKEGGDRLQNPDRTRLLLQDGKLLALVAPNSGDVRRIPLSAPRYGGVTPPRVSPGVTDVPKVLPGTLSQLFRRINGSNSVGAGGYFKVDDVVSDKPIFTFGEQHVSGARVARAVCALFDLEMEQVRGVITIRRRKCPSGVTPFTLRDSLLKVVPPTLRRALRSPRFDPNKPDKAVFMASLENRTGALLGFNAANYLINWRETALKKAGGKGIPFTALTGDERAALAIALSGQGLDAFTPRIADVEPAFITHTDGLVLRCSRTGGSDPRLQFSAYFQYPGTTRWAQASSWGNVPDLPKK